MPYHFSPMKRFNSLHERRLPERVPLSSEVTTEIKTFFFSEDLKSSKNPTRKSVGYRIKYKRPDPNKKNFTETYSSDVFPFFSGFNRRRVPEKKRSHDYTYHSQITHANCKEEKSPIRIIAEDYMKCPELL